MDAIDDYIYQRDVQVRENFKDKELEVATYNFTEHLVRTNYTKNFTWMGIPILQYPSDLMVMQEIIHKVRPYYIIECGVAFGGMTLFYKTVSGAVIIAIDKEIRPHTREVLAPHLYAGRECLFKDRILLIQGSSIDIRTVESVSSHIFYEDMPVIVSLDSNHTHDHVLKELELYSLFVSVGSYIVVFDTAIDTFGHLDKNRNQRPWGNGNNPASAVRAFLRENKNFEVDRDIEQRALITAAPGGWLRRVR